MTVLSVCQEAAVKLNQSQPASVFSTTDPFAAELALCAKEAAEAIVEAHDWQKLITLATLSGDASTLAFDLPTDYGRMLKKADVHSATWQGSMFRAAADLDDWLYLNDAGFSGSPGTWVIFGGQFRVYPAMATGETARFYYISNVIVTGSKTAFSADSDSFLLSEKLLRLGVVWRWRSNKRMEYAEDLKNFEIALSEETGKDKGSKILKIGRRRTPSDVTIAYPGTISA